jgi:signal transduction histidine kinase
MEMKISSLKESNEFLNILLDSITSAIFIVDKDVRIQSINDSFKSLFHKNEDMVLGQLCGNALGCVHAVENNADCGTTQHCSTCILRQSILQILTKKEAVYQRVFPQEFVIDGKSIRKHFQVTTKTIDFTNKEMVLVIVNDITESEAQKQALYEKNQHLTELNKQKNQLLGFAAHDLRNPMSVINSYSEILIQVAENLDFNKLKNILHLIHTSSKFSLQLLNDILDYSKIESGTLDLQKIKVSYTRFLKQSVSQNEILSTQKNISIKLNVPGNDLIFEFDPRRLEQVLNNLISNAIKFSYPGGEITISVKDGDDYIETSVKDNGQGIPESDLEYLFEPFRQTSVKSTNNEKSTGLGLAIVKKIIDVHEGKIYVKSKVGEGSVFSFQLPKK